MARATRRRQTAVSSDEESSEPPAPRRSTKATKGKKSGVSTSKSGKTQNSAPAKTKTTPKRVLLHPDGTEVENVEDHDTLVELLSEYIKVFRDTLPQLGLVRDQLKRSHRSELKNANGKRRTKKKENAGPKIKTLHSFNKKVSVTPAAQKFFGLSKSEPYMSRIEVTQHVNRYIKENELLDEVENDDGSKTVVIKPDKKLKSIMSKNPVHKKTGETLTTVTWRNLQSWLKDIFLEDAPEEFQPTEEELNADNPDYQPSSSKTASKGKKTKTKSKTKKSAPEPEEEDDDDDDNEEEENSSESEEEPQPKRRGKRSNVKGGARRRRRVPVADEDSE